MVPPDGPKNGTVKCFSSVLLLSCACGPKNGTARRSHFGTVFRFIFEVFCIKVAEAQRFGFNEALWIHEQVYSEFFGKAVHHTKLVEAQRADPAVS